MQCIFTKGTPHNSHIRGWSHEVFSGRGCLCCRLHRMHFLRWWYQTQPCQEAVTTVRRLDTTKKLKHVHPAFQLGELPCEWLKPTMCTWSQWEGGQVLLFPETFLHCTLNYGAVLKNKLLTISRHFHSACKPATYDIYYCFSSSKNYVYWCTVLCVAAGCFYWPV